MNKRFGGFFEDDNFCLAAVSDPHFKLLGFQKRKKFTISVSLSEKLKGGGVLHLSN